MVYSSGVQNVKHYEAYEQALQDGMNLTLCYLKFLFLGPPRSGKTSARRRLVREIVNLSSLGQPSKSTGVAETYDVVIKKLVCESTAIVNSMWQSIHRSQGGSSSATKQEGELTQLARWFYQVIANAKESGDAKNVIQRDVHNMHSIAVITSDDGESDPSSAAASKPFDHKLPGSHSSGSYSAHSKDLDIKAALEELSTILQSDNPVKLEQVLKELIMISMVDIGGQPALMEMLPSLTIGPALYFLFFRLDQELGKSYPVCYHAADSEKETILESSYCTESVLYQSLSSIACFGSCSQQDGLSSGVLLFGTYKDQVDRNRISQMSSTLKQKLSKTKLYEKGLLLKTSKGEMFFPVDNMNGNESEMSEIRSDIEEIIRNNFLAADIPAAWLMFRIVLHLLRKPVVCLAQCQAIARKLSMPTSVKEALWYFHHNIGNLMYYSDIPSMRDIVICDPQVIFDSVSELILDRFQYSNRSFTSHEVDQFHHSGQFSLAQIEDKTKNQRRGHLEPTQLVDLLKELNIIAEIKEDNDELKVIAADQPKSHTPDWSLLPIADQPQRKFIMPAVLKYASEEDLKVPAITDCDNQSIPIMIHFEDGYVPFGVFCTTTAHLIAHQRWKLGKIMKNKVEFSIDKAFLVTIIARGQYLEMHVSRQHPRAHKETSLSLICSNVRQAVVESLQSVISKMKFNRYSILQKKELLDKSQQLFSLAFTCTICCHEESDCDHLMKVVKSLSSVECLKTNVEIEIEKKQTIWFYEVRRFKPVADAGFVGGGFYHSIACENFAFCWKPCPFSSALERCFLPYPSIHSFSVEIVLKHAVMSHTSWFLSSSAR